MTVLHKSRVFAAMTALLAAGCSNPYTPPC